MPFPDKFIFITTPEFSHNHLSFLGFIFYYETKLLGQGQIFHILSYVYIYI